MIRKVTSKNISKNHRIYSTWYSRSYISLYIAFRALEGDKTYQITQNDIRATADESTQQKIFDLRLNQFGPYRMDYTRNGR